MRGQQAEGHSGRVSLVDVSEEHMSYTRSTNSMEGKDIKSPIVRWGTDNVKHSNVFQHWSFREEKICVM